MKLNVSHTYDIIYSLGYDCACAIYMLKYGLRTYAGPFDWIKTPFSLNDDFQRKIECILTDFKDFLNQEDFRFLPKTPDVFNDERCDYYENIKTGFYFYHDFPVGIPMEESLPKVKERYQHRIDRFYSEIRKNKRVLLIWFSHYSFLDNNLQIKMCNEVCKKFGKQVDFLFIEHTKNLPIGKIEKTLSLSSHITKYSVYTRKWDAKGKLTTLGQEEICGTIFSTYKLHLTKRIRLYFVKLKNKLVKDNLQT